MTVPLPVIVAVALLLSLGDIAAVNVQEAVKVVEVLIVEDDDAVQVEVTEFEIEIVLDGD